MKVRYIDAIPGDHSSTAPSFELADEDLLAELSRTKKISENYYCLLVEANQRLADRDALLLEASSLLSDWMCDYGDMRWGSSMAETCNRSGDWHDKHMALMTMAGTEAQFAEQIEAGVAAADAGQLTDIDLVKKRWLERRQAAKVHPTKS